MATLQEATTKASISLIQAVKYLPTQYLPELGGEGGENNTFNKQRSKQRGCASELW